MTFRPKTWLYDRMSMAPSSDGLTVHSAAVRRWIGTDLARRWYLQSMQLVAQTCPGGSGLGLQLPVKSSEMPSSSHASQLAPIHPCSDRLSLAACRSTGASQHHSRARPKVYWRGRQLSIAHYRLPKPIHAMLQMGEAGGRALTRHSRGVVHVCRHLLADTLRQWRDCSTSGLPG